MPNWVTNHLTIIGEPAELVKLKDQLAQKRINQHYNLMTNEFETVEENSPFSFWNIVKPVDIENYFDKPSRDQTHPNHWYKWNNENWGTKWDACDVEIEDVDDSHIVYKFQTAWSPADPALIKLSEQFPDLEMSLEWQEEQGFGGEILYTEGNGVEISYYDYKCWECDEIYKSIDEVKFDEEEGRHLCAHKTQDDQ